ncbi:hypothetical protein ABT120_29375 [Nonomuraea angiospora]|uniref:hypothetical protein n=1 Tax=Nonomuraea angiospora TaxID=46172 RepID=UPI0033299C1F
MFLAGSSAGAHLSAMVALTSDDPTSMAGVIGLGGYYGEGPRTSPLAHVRRDAPPSSTPSRRSAR